MAAVAGDSAVRAVAPLFQIYVYRPQRAAVTSGYGTRRSWASSVIERCVARWWTTSRTQQAYVESLYQWVDKSSLRCRSGDTEPYFRLSAPTGARSLRDHTSFELLRPWAEASKDQEFTAALVWLGVAGATEALSFQPVRKANAALLKAIREDVQ